MNLHEIENLLEKYYEGQTTLSEEEQLRIFFTSDNVPGHLKSHAIFFKFFAGEKKQHLLKDDFDKDILSMIDSENKKSPVFDLRNPWVYWISGIAATVLILIAIFVRFDPLPGRISNTYDDPERAYVEARKILLFVSSKLNQGTSQLEPVTAMEKGIGEMKPLAAFKVASGQVKRLDEVDKVSKMITRN